MKRNMQLTAWAAAMACTLSWTFPIAGLAAGPSPDQLDANESRQAAIRAQTEQAQQELDRLIGEFSRNNLGDSADVQILRAIRGKLGTLSDKDMKQVIALLKGAKEARDANAARKVATDAFSGQKGIVVELRHLLLQYQQQQELTDLSLRFAQLAERQNANLKGAVRLYRQTQAASRQWLDTQKTSLTVQQIEQDALRDECKQLVDRLAKLTKQVDAETSAKLAAVTKAAEEGKLADALSRAADDLKDTKLMSAAGYENTARNQLRDLSRLVAPTKDPIQVLRAAADELLTNISQQRFVQTQSRSLPAKLDPPKPDVEDKAADFVYMLEDKQADVVDAVNMMRKNLEEIAPEAALELKAGQDEMQIARDDIRNLRKDLAGKRAETALGRLTTARQKVLEALARLENRDLANNLLDKVKDLKAQITALREREEGLKKTTVGTGDSSVFADLAKLQGELKKTDHELQLIAAAEAPAAAKPLLEAGREMDGAQTSLGKSDGSEAARQEQAAIDQLKKAEQALDERIAQLEQTKSELEKLQKARDEVAKMIIQQQKVELGTAKLAALQDKAAKPEEKKPEEKKPEDRKPEDKKPEDKKAEEKTAEGKKEDPKGLAKQEGDLAKNAENTARDVGDLAKDANKALNDAAKNMKGAQNDLAKPDAKAAEPKTTAADADLNKAKNALDDQIAAKEKELGQQPDAGKLDDLAKALDKAQDDLNKAMGDQVAEIAKGQQQVANDLKQMAQDGKPVADAQKAAQAAADALKNNDLPQAGKAMEQAQEGMQKAMKQDGQKGEPDKGKPEGKAEPKGGDPAAAKPDLGKTAEKQKDLQKQLAQLAGEQPPNGEAMGDVANDVAAAAAEDGGAAPPDAQAAMNDAQQSLNKAAAEAAAGNKPGSKEAAGKAQASLAQAAAAVAAAKGGAPMPGKGPPGQTPGQLGMLPGPADENSAKQGTGDRKDTNANASGQTGPRVDAKGSSSYLGLPPRDREAIQQSRNERYPEEYGTQIEQYLKNISDQSSK